MNNLLKILLLSLVFNITAGATDLKDRLREDVCFMCDSLSGGRATGSAGAQNVAMYMLRQFRDLGLRADVQSFDASGKAGHNIYAVTPGWFRSYIVVTAYYDGLGRLGDELYPGADANASGAAALLELARTIPSRAQSEIGVIFVALDGHNASLSGAAAILNGPLKDFKKILVANIDIIGSSLAPLHKDRPDYIMALGASGYRLIMDNCNRHIGLDIAYDYYGSRAFTDLFYKKISDQRAFMEKGIPAVMFTSGITMNTNKTGDTPDSLDYEVFAKRVMLMSNWLGALLEGNENIIKFASY